MTKSQEQEYDRAKELKQFSETKSGVKGLVDSGITSIPRIFRLPPDTIADLKPDPKAQNLSPPLIDLTGFDSDRRAAVVEQVSRAAREIGFFHVINHGVPQAVLDRTIAGVKGFHEQPAKAKARLYGGGLSDAVSYWSNYDLYRSKAATWRDTLWVRLTPEPPMEKIPEASRDAVREWDREVSRVGELVVGLLEEGLGLPAGRFRELMCLERRTMMGQYYPHCPEPDQTLGFATHTDPGILTVVLQNHLGGLQIKSSGRWVDVKPVPGSLTINIADLLQIMSNDEYQSVEHRVLANSSQEARVSIVVFFSPSENNDKPYGPLPELICSEKPAVYQNFIFSDYINIVATKNLAGISLKNYYKI